MDEPYAETISSEEPGEPWPRAEDGRSAGRRTRLTAVTAALSLVLVGGVATAAYRGLQHGTDPAALIPGSAFGAVVADLSMPGQGDALATFAGHFPDSPTRTGSGSAVQRLLRAMFRDSSDPHVDYDTDVAPWLGDHVAVAGWVDDGTPHPEFLLEVRDESAARRHLTELFDRAGGTPPALQFRDGYAVLSDTEPALTAALAAADHASLAHDADYAADVARLPSGEAAVAWLDGPAVRSALGAAGADLPPGPGSMLGMSGAGSSFAGRVAAGLHVTDDYAEVDAVEVGAPAGATAPATMLTDLPGGTVGAVTLGGPDRAVQQVTKALETFLPFAAPMELSSSVGACAVPAPPGTTSQPPPPAVPLPSPSGAMLVPAPQVSPLPGTAVARVAPISPRKLARMMNGRHGAVVRERNARRLARMLRRHRVGRRPFAPECTRHFAAPKPVDPLEQVRRATGLRLPQDAVTLLGDAAVVSYGGITLGGPPDVAIRSHPADLAAAKAVAATLSKALEKPLGSPLGVTTAGDDLVVATSQRYAGLVAADGDLGDQQGFTTAMGDVPERLAVGGYVDLSRVWPLLGGDVPTDLHHVEAIGFWSGRDGTVQRSQLRVVAG